MVSVNFQFILIHSTNTLNRHFFKNNLYIYSKQINNNDFSNAILKEYVNLYVNRKIGKQYFGTFYGQHRINGKFVLATKEEFKNLLKELRIFDYSLQK